jgi:RHH-type transcriptional regulator, rel operon repressor / antitoxin RelB
MLTIRLPRSIEKRLEKLARRTGRTKTHYVLEAILEHLEDIEDQYLAEGVLERVRSGEERTIPLKEVMKKNESRIKLAALRAAIAEGDQSGIAQGDVFARVRKRLKRTAAR